ncbi:Gfo/Idh/MocA family protein [Olivibacter domesticus]|uniref:Predicted dehydrogenase n=1 Tax=Olivibacter domesticus TaxID=407022 RepID=A0A1H7XYV3_OLID1|nr:Gfo/Idh/MocA family oxidoreductase [Olivibacter domesticus]SEM38881.1 Predicted dehydrogenase [Olivibacter domesticus]
MVKNVETLNTTGRRSFLKKSSLAILGSTLAYHNSLATPLFAAKKNTLKVGLIGCGGRGTGAAAQALQADPDVIITAMGDVFEDRLEEAYAALVDVGADRVKVEKKNKYIGFDAYQQVLDSGVDVVLLATPPGFRPDHLTAAVKAGKHIFCEKPVAVDAPGVRKVLAAAKIASEKNLSLVSGFCFRYDFSNRAIFGKILEGNLGEVRSVSTFRNGGELWTKPRQPEWTEMTNQMRNWYYYNWLSGDFIVEQSVHSIDMMSWAMGDELPIRATGTGGRQVRVDPVYGNIFDHFAIEFEYENGAKGFHFTRQQAGTSNRNSVDVLGTDGNAIINIGSKYEITGKNKWRYDGKKNNMYQTQHDELFAAIREGKPINDGKWMANSTMLAIWARMAGYSGQTISWEQALNSNQVLGPKIEDYDWNLQWEGPAIAIPGSTKFV